jgi:hypothetical protein
MWCDSKFQGLPTTAVILKFELMYAPTVENGWVIKVVYLLAYRYGSKRHGCFFLIDISLVKSVYWVEFTIYSADLQAALDDYPAAVHEFRIPPKALLGLHSYCPVHFDAFHAALVDVSVHASLLRAAPYLSALKVPRFVTSNCQYEPIWSSFF